MQGQAIDRDLAARWARVVKIERRPYDPEGVAYRLEYARALAGLSQSQLARDAGLSRDTVMRYEGRRRTGATLATMHALARALGVDAVWLAYGDEGRTPS